MKRIALGILLALCGVSAAAQTTTVTGVSVDANGNPYFPGTVSAVIVLNSGQVLPAGVPASGSIGPFPTTSGGNFSITVASPLTWVFTVCSTPTNIGPRGSSTPSQVCYSTAPILVVGATQSISANLSPLLLGPGITGGGGTGCVPASPVNALQKNNGAGGCATSSITDNGLSVTIDEDTNFKGPNPWNDVTRYGVRAINAAVAPAIPGITANCTATSASVTLSSASIFLNGDGVDLYGCGAAHTMTTPTAPTVTPAIARVMTGTGDVVAGLTGATTYNYKIIACNVNQGCTAASPAGTTATGAAALGSQTVNITSASRSNATVTVLTAAAHGLTVGSMVYIQSMSDTNFNGWYQVNSVADTTHFTFLTGLDTRNGASTSATGGNLTRFNCNHVSWTAVTGAYRYYIYSDRAVPGTFALIGVSKPTSSTGLFTDGTLYWDDFGSPMMDALRSAPLYVPATAPAAATANSLVTTISSGGGTTTLTLAATAGTTKAGATILFDNAPNLAAMSSLISAYFPLPTTGTYVINSPVTMGTWVGGNQTIQDTVQTGSQYSWRGSQWGQIASATSFQFESYPNVNCKAIPCLHVGYLNPGGGVTGRVDGLSFLGFGNQDILILQDGGGGSGGPAYERLNFNTNTEGDGVDYMGMGFMGRGQAGATSVILSMKEVLGIASLAQTNGISATPHFYFDDASQIVIDSVFFNRRGILNRPDPASNFVFIGNSHIQGPITPLVTFTGQLTTSGTISTTARVNFSEIDTGFHPVAAYLPSFGGTLVVLKIYGATISGNALSGNPFSYSETCSGQNIQCGGVVPAGAFSAPAFDFTDAAVRVEGPGNIGSPLGTMAAPAVSNVAGTLPAGTYTYTLLPVDADGNTGPFASLTSLPCTSNGSQNCVLTWTLIPGQVSTTICRTSGGTGCAATGLGFQVTGTTFTDTGAALFSQSLTTGRGALHFISSAGVTGATFRATNSGFIDTITASLTANRNKTLPDISGTFTMDIASGTATLGTAAIASGACATVVTVAATGALTTDTITTGFNGDPTAVTGYGASATGAVLTIYVYPTLNNVNVKVCNSTAASITPAPLTLNWKVTR